ncbi:MAG: pentapeptide repeat-containing protein [Sulfuricurvum sp.]|nr:pentapeptide repeat-containing protein [Sulfuricurvum sp.]MDP3023539.1 pentapeptide repeat-containing protein [Sulfuricurvum sp.]
MTCKTKNCNYEVFKKDEFCIFHCEKNSWYTSKGKIKNWNSHLVTTFWKKFQEHLEINKNCNSFIFPEDQYYVEESSGDFTSAIQWNNLTLEDISFDKSKFLVTPSFVGLTIKNCSFRNCNTESMLFMSCKLDNCNFQGIQIDNVSMDGCHIENCNLQWISSKEFTMFASKIENTNFTNSYFYFLDLSDSSAKNCSFQNTKLSSGTRDTYRILKHYHDEVKNDIQASQFYAKEMQIYCKDIFMSPYYSFKSVINTFANRFKSTYTKDKYLLRIKKDIQTLLGDLNKLFAEGPILIFNLLISNYGQNWFMPLFWFTVSSTVIFDHIMPTTAFDINQFAMFINPFLNSTDTALYKTHYALWLIHKVLATIFLYHFVMAVKQKTRRIN